MSKADEDGLRSAVWRLTHVDGESLMGLTLDEAWESDAVQALLTERDLLWYGPAEWASVGGR